MLAMSYFNAFELPVIIARPFNTYGPRQSARAIIPTIITQILSGAKTLKLGDLTPIRDLNFVQDTCEGFVSLLGLENYGETFNIGSGRGVSMQEVLEMIEKICNTKVQISQDKSRIRPKNSEVFKLICDSSKLQNASSWRSKISLEEGLKRTIKWFEKDENLAKYKAGVYNV